LAPLRSCLAARALDSLAVFSSCSKTEEHTHRRR
jgi:hypothetical protein